MRLSLKYKVILAFLFLSFLPIAILAYVSFVTIREAGKSLIVQMICELEKDESKRLIKEAENYAHKIAIFLKERKGI